LTRLLPSSRQQLGSGSKFCATTINRTTIRAYCQPLMTGPTRPSSFQGSRYHAMALPEALTMIRLRVCLNIACRLYFLSAYLFPSASSSMDGPQNGKYTGWFRILVPVSSPSVSSFASTVPKRTSLIPIRHMQLALRVRQLSSGLWRASHSRYSRPRCTMRLELAGVIACLVLSVCSWGLSHLWFYGGLGDGCEAKVLIVLIEWFVCITYKHIRRILFRGGHLRHWYQYFRMRVDGLGTLLSHIDAPAVTSCIKPINDDLTLVKILFVRQLDCHVENEQWPMLFLQSAPCLV
jgi:hypothetical protein